MNRTNLLLIRFSAVFAVIGAILGAHMAGSGSYAFRPIHAHSLVVGWLTLFAWGVYYQLFTIRSRKLQLWHSYTAIVGTIGLTAGMWLYYLKPFALAEGLQLGLFITGGVTLLVSFFLFLATTFLIVPKER